MENKKKTLKKVEFADLNQSMERTTGAEFRNNPWRENVMTLTCLSIIFMRSTTCLDGKVESTFKLLDGLELMALQGFDPSFFAPHALPDHQLGSHMAGNMFNIFMITAFVISTTAGSAIHDIKEEETSPAPVDVDAADSYSSYSEELQEPE